MYYVFCKSLFCHTWTLQYQEVVSSLEANAWPALCIFGHKYTHTHTHTHSYECEFFQMLFLFKVRFLKFDKFYFIYLLKKFLPAYMG